MLTLTVPGQGVHSISGANALLTSWMNSGNAGIRGGASAKFFGGAYLAFPERHKRHGWHWHILTNRRIDSRAVQVSWTRHCHLLGHSSVTSLHARVHTKDFGSSRSAAAYASKYVGKAIDQVSDEMGRHRYRVGEAVEAPVPSYDLVMGADVHEAAWTVLGPYVHLQPRVCHVSGAGPPAVWAGW